ncbi:MAG: K(+)-transporting ATPase subunit F [Prolixibacteraceae bacterium]|jgi:K+-transporting ATPase KdpF subunit|nr:K(+)-transporting ATPase subunit F [Prolixibacteraceae bacterium]
MYAIILLTNSKAFEENSSTGYIIGAVIATLILGYLIYSLLKPEKF